MCAIRYNDDTPLKQFLVVTNQLQDYVQKRNYFECFSGGRTNHRTDLVYPPYGADLSIDWGVRLSARKDETSTTLQVMNGRDEDIWLKLVVNGSDVLMNHKSPIERVVEAKDSQDLVIVSKKLNGTDPVMMWAWRAEPVVYRQRESEKQVSSNGVTVSVEHRATESIFTVFNDRSDHDTPVYVWLDIIPQAGTARENLWLSRKRPMRVAVRSHHKVRVLTVRPVDIKRPWYFTFNYKWQSGGSPDDIFGTK